MYQIRPEHNQIAMNIINNAQKTLIKRKMGGVTARSAFNAIHTGINDAIVFGEKNTRSGRRPSEYCKNSIVDNVSYLSKRILQKGTLGGVTRKSAIEAVTNAVLDVIERFELM